MPAASCAGMSAYQLRYALPLCILAATIAGGCGGNDRRVSDDIADAIARTSGQTSATLVVSGVVRRTRDGFPVRYRAVGRVSFTRWVGRFRLNPVRSVGAVADDPGSATGALILEPSAVYLRSDALAHALDLQSDRWLRVRLSGRVSDDAVDFLPIGDVLNAVGSLGRVTGVSRGAQRLGTGVMHGIKTTRFRATLRRQQGPRRVLIRSELWIDGAGLVRRLHERYSYGASREAPRTDQWIEFLRFGVPVDVSTPARVVDARRVGRQGQARQPLVSRSARP